MKMRRFAMQKGMAVAVIGLVAAILGTAPASALTLDGVTGSWSNVVGGTNVGFHTVGDEEQVRWGDPFNGDQSGLGFTGEPPPPVVFDVGDPFVIGTLRHFNNVIASGSAASSADLTIVLDFSDPDLPPLVGLTFSLSVNETPNGGGCPVGSPPCADIIGFPSAFPDETFDIGGVAHTLELVGFWNGDAVVHEFISQEGGTNSAVLVGRITQAPIPEPTSAFMFGTGCLVVARSLKRSRRPTEG